MFKIQRDTCIDCLERVLNGEWMERCKEFIEIGREQQHKKTLERQKDKLYRLIQKNKGEGDCTGIAGNHSNNNNNNTNHVQANINGNINDNNWVKNLSSTPLTPAQINVLSHGPNYAVVPKNPPVGEYIVAIENVCNQLPQGKAEELRGVV